MPGLIRDRILAVLLVALGGTELVSEDYMTAIVVVLLAILDQVKCRVRAKAGADAVARAAVLHPDDALDDPSVSAAMRRAGVVLEDVMRSIERERMERLSTPVSSDSAQP